MNEILKKIENFGIIPVVKIENTDSAIPLGKALIKGGLPIAEITYRTECATEAIYILSKELPDIIDWCWNCIKYRSSKKASGCRCEIYSKSWF